MSDFNPYQAPGVSISSSPVEEVTVWGEGVWREGTTLVMAKGADLPRRCLSCNAPATFLLRRSLSRYPPTLLALLILPGVGPFLLIIVIAIIRKQARFGFLPLCDHHRRRRAIQILVGTVVAGVGLATCFVPVFDKNLAFLNPVGVILLFLGLLHGVMKAQAFLVQKSTTTHAWFTRVCPSYLEALPPFSSGAKPIDFEF